MADVEANLQELEIHEEKAPENRRKKTKRIFVDGELYSLVPVHKKKGKSNTKVTPRVQHARKRFIWVQQRANVYKKKYNFLPKSGMKDVLEKCRRAAEEDAKTMFPRFEEVMDQYYDETKENTKELEAEDFPINLEQ